ncbi:MAG: hypothetical protein CMF61_03220 [Magnetococcales bacterium]|nr:hypothetical protein [Magnetococcales bacterium]PPR18234.1 MAG: hypothetical protein CFH43_00539 [Pseudomonadota bacterium]
MNNPKRYNSTIITLHWVMALAFFLMLGSGITLEYIELEKSFKFELYQWHKSGGILLLIAIIARIFVKIVSTNPKLPASFTKIEVTAAKLGHYALYLAMIAMVGSGWLMVSSSSYGLPTIVFGWFEWPHIPNLTGNKDLNQLSKIVHFYGFITFIILILGHIGAVVAHYKKENINLVKRMWWSKFTFVLAAALTIATPAFSNPLEIDSVNSKAEFSGTHAGNVFTGQFNEWNGTIDLENKIVKASFKTKSASTENPMYDGTLPTPDWFNAQEFPLATFESTNVEELSNNTYQVTGNLTIKDTTKPLSFNMNISEKSSNSLKGSLKFTMNRLDYKIGTSSDPTGEWVSIDIPVEVTFIAQ